MDSTQKQFKTRTSRLIELLTENPGRAFTAKEICDVLELESESEVYSLLSNASRILRRKGATLTYSPPVCRKCGFVMDKMDASRCPKCKSEWIEPARFRLECRQA